MTVKETLSQLKALGNEKMFAQNKRNGASDNQFGVRLGEIKALSKKIKTNHTLALELWETENVEARLLAILLIDPKLLSNNKLDQLVKSVTFTQIADWLNAYVIKQFPNKEELRIEWLKSNNPMAAGAGWNLTAQRVVKNPEGLDLPVLLDRLESEMGNAHPLIQWTMNFVLAEIGIHNPNLRERAISIGNTLGIYKDYPTSKGCTSPFAPIWIEAKVSRLK